MKEKKREDQESEQWARRSVTNVPLHFVLVNAFSNNLSTVRIQRLQKKSISVIQKKSVVNDNDDNEKKTNRSLQFNYNFRLMVLPFDFCEQKEMHNKKNQYKQRNAWRNKRKRVYEKKRKWWSFGRQSMDQKKNEQQKEKFLIIARSAIHSCHTISVIICLKK